uniref:Uncharacterized protein n=1 Tax=Kalanchoe fedtschenkoi TaxID=63787 RepID=A0A7N0U9X6_KALFE
MGSSPVGTAFTLRYAGGARELARSEYERTLSRWRGCAALVTKGKVGNHYRST